MYNILEYNSLRNIIPLQYEEIVKGLDNCERMQDGFRLEFTDKNYNCLPYLDAVLDSRTHGLSFFSGCGGLDIGAQMAGIKVLSSLDFAKEAVETMKKNKFFAHACHMLNDIRNVTRQASWLHSL